MKSELEQEFYDTFGIEPLRHVCYRGFDNCIDNDYNCHCHNKKPCKDSHAIYPEITAEKLLEMICVLSQWDADNYYQILANNMQDLKNEILNDCVNFKQKLKNAYFNAEIQQLFKD